MLSPEREAKLRTPGFVEDDNYCMQDIFDLLAEIDRLREKLAQMTQSVLHTPLNIFGDKSGADLLADFENPNEPPRYVTWQFRGDYET